MAVESAGVYAPQRAVVTLTHQPMGTKVAQSDNKPAKERV